MISCEELTDRVTDYLDGRLPMGQKMGTWLHLALCHHCRRYIRQMKQTIDLVSELPKDLDGGGGEHTKEELLARFRQSHSDS